MYVARQIDRWIYIEKDQYIQIGRLIDRQILRKTNICMYVARQIDRWIDIEKDQYMNVARQKDDRA